MSERSISISPKELLSLVEWLATFDYPPHEITIITSSNSGIGTSVRAEVKLTENEGRFKDLTDYENW